MKLNLVCLLFLLRCFIIAVNSTTTTTCKSCIKAFNLNNTLIGNTIVTPDLFNVTIFGNAAYNNLVEHGPPMNVTGTTTTPYNIQPIIDIIDMTFPCDCNATYSGTIVPSITIYPGKTCFTTSVLFLGGPITFDALGDPSSVFILTFQSAIIHLQYYSVLINNAQSCNINLITPGQFAVIVFQPLYGNFFANEILFGTNVDIYGGLYASNIINFGGTSNIYGCLCQLPENQYNQCTPHTNHKQIIYNVKCSNSLPCSQ